MLLQSRDSRSEIDGIINNSNSQYGGISIIEDKPKEASQRRKIKIVNRLDKVSSQNTFEKQSFVQQTKWDVEKVRKTGVNFYHHGHTNSQTVLSRNSEMDVRDVNESSLQGLNSIESLLEGPTHQPYFTMN